MSRHSPKSLTRRSPGQKRLVRRLKGIYTRWFPQPKTSSQPARRRAVTSSRTQAIVLLLSLLSLIPLTYLLLTRVLVIRHVTCTLNQAPCPDFIQAELNHLVGQPYFQLNLQPVSAKITGFNPSIVNISHRFTPPQTLNLHLSQAPSLAYLAVSSQSATLTVSSNHYITHQSSEEPLSGVIIASQSADLKVGQGITDHQLLLAFDLTELLHDYYISYHHLDINQPDKAVLSLTNSTTAYLSLFLNLEHQVKALSILLNQLPENSPAHIIDLRPQNPILRSNTPSFSQP